MLLKRGKRHATGSGTRSDHPLQMDGIDDGAKLGEDRALGFLKPRDTHSWFEVKLCVFGNGWSE